MCGRAKAAPAPSLRPCDLGKVIALLLRRSGVPGTDGQLLSALVVGVHGAVGSTYNFNGVMQNRIIDAFKAGDLTRAADAQHDVIECLGATLGAVDGVNGGKALMNLIGSGSRGERGQWNTLSEHGQILHWKQWSGRSAKR